MPRLKANHDPSDNARHGAFAHARRATGGRVLPLALACALCLPAVSCKGEHDATAQSESALTPTDLFSRRAPKPKPGKPLRLLVVGDSLSISLGEQMERALGQTAGIDFTRDGTRSTGLTRPALLDWPAHLRERVAQNAPDVVVIMIGANDVMPIEGTDGSRIFFDNPSWPQAYAAKAWELVSICRTANAAARVYWVGVPAMGDPELAKGTARINAALASMCASTPGCRFIETQAAFSDPSGRFSRHGRDAATGDLVTLRTADGVHMTDAGAKLLSGIVLAALAKGEKLPPIAGADELRAFARDLRPMPDQAALPAPETRPTARASGKIYTVKKGDTILGIAHRLGVVAKDLLEVNPGADSTHLSLGQTLRIPVKR